MILQKLPEGINKEEFSEAIELAALRELCLKSFYHFFVEFWDTVVAEKLIEGPHIKIICDELQHLGESVIRRESPGYEYLVINIPPGTSKSTICSILFPAWLWAKDASLKVITSSYSFDASSPHSQKSKDCIKSDKFQAFYGHLFQIRKDIDNIKVFNTDKMGARITTSSGGSIVSKHAHLIIPDDPHKPPDPEKEMTGATPAELKSDVRWHFSSLASRRVDETWVPFLVVMQRLSDKDLCGELEKMEKLGLKVKWIKLPADLDYEVVPKELKSIYVDGVLDPIRKPQSVLDNKKITLGTYGYAGQYGQNPAPPEGGIIKKAWFKRIQESEVPEGGIFNFYGDTAFTKLTKNDPSGIIAYKVVGKNMYIFGVSIVRMEFPQICKHIPQYCLLLGYNDSSRIRIEPKASGVSIVQEIKQKTGLNIVEDKIKGKMADKETRMMAQTAKLESGRVYLVGDGAWIDPFVTSCGQFPNGAHDEEIDILEGAMRNDLKDFNALDAWKL